MFAVRRRRLNARHQRDLLQRQRDVAIRPQLCMLRGCSRPTELLPKGRRSVCCCTEHYHKWCRKFGFLPEPTPQQSCDKSAWQFGFCTALRALQNESNCSTRHLERVAQILSPYFAQPVPLDVGMADRFLHKKAGVTVKELVACARCANSRVWTSANVPTRCPQCHQPLKNGDGDLECVYYFPLGSRLEALMRTGSYQHLPQ